MTESEKAEILHFLSMHPVGVLSTIHKGTKAPESALVAFAETPNFQLIFQTLRTARKYENIKSDPRVSFVVGWGTEKAHQITFQYEGRAEELDADSEKYQKYREIFEQKKTPCTFEFLDNPHSRIFVITPTWLGYSDYRQEKPRIIEHRF